MIFFTLNKGRRILHNAYHWYQKDGKKMAPDVAGALEKKMTALESAINSGDKEKAKTLSMDLEEFVEAKHKKGFIGYLFEVVAAVAIALVLAVVVRQIWFELYEIPTGSMRPTFREQDHVAVTKTPFGLNIPMTTGHFLFEPDLVQRTSVVTFTSEDIPGLDEDTSFMWVIPYKKRLIKRMIGKPGDSLYFYGGKIYAVDQNGKPISEFLESPWMKNLEHIPFITFDGDVSQISANEYEISQMNQHIARVAFLGSNPIAGQVYDGSKWIKEDPSAQKTPHSTIKAYTDYMGMRNFAMARLLTAEDLKELESPELIEGLPKAELYLELRHDPSLTNPKPLKTTAPFHPLVLNPYRSLIPLEKRHLDSIMDHMYTARLVFKNNRARRYDVNNSAIGAGSPRFADIPDGTYEFYEGKLSKIGWGGISYEVSKDNPLYSRDPVNVHKLFNMGIEMDLVFEPNGPIQLFYPSRYAYFRDGDLYLLGAPILKKDDPVLVDFNKREEKRESQATASKPYAAFKDHGPPMKDGKYDVDLIKSMGLKIPEKQYIVLGDNHAMSADSRRFGFVPEANLQGAPSLILWPPGERWGVPEQKPYPFMNLPRAIVWSVVGALALIAYLWHLRNIRKPIQLTRRDELST